MTATETRILRTLTVGAQHSVSARDAVRAMTGRRLTEGAVRYRLGKLEALGLARSRIVAVPHLRGRQRRAFTLTERGQRALTEPR